MLDSSAIVDTMHEMLDKSEESLAQTRKREAAAQAPALLNRDRENTVKVMKEELIEPTQFKSIAYEVRSRGEVGLLEKLLNSFEDQADLYNQVNNDLLMQQLTDDLKRDSQTSRR